jgi:tRNA nucleotidyltransferase/poly(A) polymerase
MPALKEPIQLNALEQKIFTTLKDAVQHFQLCTRLRCAGGWVRDKLLGQDSSSPDIDIALEDILGKDFAQKVNEYLASQGEAVATIGVIQCNPDQSKHLETARMKARVAAEPLATVLLQWGP